MVTVVYTARFLRQLKKLEPDLIADAQEKIKIFAKDQHEPILKTHKLHGKFKDFWSFSVNYKYRIVFMYDDANTITLLRVGDHSIYN